MRIVCWNVRGATAGSAGWDYLLQCAPDVALLQEVRSVPDSVRTGFACRIVAATGRKGTAQEFSTAILVRGRLGDPVPLLGPEAWVDAELRRFAGSFVTSEVAPTAGVALMAVSVHSPAWAVPRDWLAGIDVSAVRLTQQKRDIWTADLLRSALGTGVAHSPTPWVVGGDFNLSETFDQWNVRPRGNREYLDGMAGLGFVECLRAAQGALTPTYRNTDRRTIKHQMDHLFVSAALAARLRSCNVGSADDVFGRDFSDHLPIIADFDMDGTSSS